MHLTIDIQEMAQPIVNDTKRVSFIVRFIYFLKDSLISKYNNHLTTFNLALEGTINRIDDLSIDTATKLLLETKKIIISIEKVEVKLAGDNYLDSSEVKDNIKYALQCLYKMESKLHKNVYKTSPVIMIDSDIKEGISKMNASNVHELLSC